MFMLRNGSDKAVAIGVLFLDRVGTVLWYQGMSRVVPGQVQQSAGAKQARAAVSSIANAYAAPSFGASDRHASGV